MCDTQVLVHGDTVLFAKNSDREPSEAQRVVRLAPVRGDRRSRVRVTHVEIDQVPDRHGVILSQPAWMWGAEMGANDRGVVIGNEAIFSRAVSRRPALLGMDLVRLGLERGASARGALEVITELLERHGQGGRAGYRDARFSYDNSYILADAGEAWVLETAGRHWVAKRVRQSAAISNCLTLDADVDLSSAEVSSLPRHRGRARDGAVGFAGAFDTRLMPWLAGARSRLALSRRSLARTAAAPKPGLGHMMAHLRCHRRDGIEPSQGSTRDVCMHAGSPLRPHQSCAAMVSRLSPRGAVHLVTGTSATCLSIFRPVGFESDVPYHALAPERGEPELWWRHERVHRHVLFDDPSRRALVTDRDRAERSILARVDRDPGEVTAADLREADEVAREWQGEQVRRWGRNPPRVRPFTPYGAFWWHLGRRDRANLAGPATME
jgi:secernin